MNNMDQPVERVRHRDLKRIGRTPHKSVCPACPVGTLHLRRHPDTMLLLNTDTCLNCGQQFLYTDLPNNELGTLLGYKYPKS